MIGPCVRLELTDTPVQPMRDTLVAVAGKKKGRGGGGSASC